MPIYGKVLLGLALGGVALLLLMVVLDAYSRTQPPTDDVFLVDETPG